MFLVAVTCKNKTNAVVVQSIFHHKKSVHLDDLAIRVGFNYVASPESSDDVIDALKENANKRKQLVMTDIGPWLATIAIVLLVIVYLPTHLLRRSNGF
jgi:hypothetical protein